MRCVKQSCGHSKAVLTSVLHIAHMHLHAGALHLSHLFDPTLQVNSQLQASYRLATGQVQATSAPAVIRL